MSVLFNRAIKNIYHGIEKVKLIYAGDKLVYDNTTPISAEDPLTFTATQDFSSVTLNANGSPVADGLQYREGTSGQWLPYTPGTTIQLTNEGDTVQFQNTKEQLSTSESDYVQFSTTGQIEASGNVQSMVNYSQSCTQNCYTNLFEDCTSLTTAPQLPSTQLANNCYSDMFSGCTSLTEAPQLPATQLADSCYSGMFSGCTSLTEAPQLPATQLTDGCYSDIFNNCTSLETVKVHFTQWLDGATDGWLEGTPENSTIIKPTTLPETTGTSNIPEGWIIQNFTAADPLTFTATQASSSVTLNVTGSPVTDGLQYREGTSGQWLPYTPGTTIELTNEGDTIQFQNTKEQLSTNSSNFVQFSMTGEIAASGNVQSMVNYSQSCTQNCYTNLFEDCTSLTTAPQLPATQLANSCYSDMFSGCTSLTEAPQLPATQLANNCYSDMFSGCTSLTEAPELPATQLADGCYSDMFSGCTSLTEAPELPATQLANNCYSDMFSGCTSLTEAPELPANTLADSCYSDMFSGCTSLTEAPELPATQLADGCYQNMFSGCTSLTEAPELPATQLADGCYQNMFNNCTSLTEAPVLPATVLANSCYSGMFSGCTSLEIVQSALPAATLTPYCYQSMFQGCTSLTKAPELLATQLAYKSCQDMYKNCTSLKTVKVYFTQWLNGATDGWLEDTPEDSTIIKPSVLPQITGPNNIPEGWTIQNFIVEDPLTFTATQDFSSVTLNANGSPVVDGLQYREGTSGQWLPYTPGTTIELTNEGDTVQFKNTKEQLSTSESDYVQFSMTGKIAASGNIQSMLNYSQSCSDYCYYKLFADWTSLKEAPQLPATKLAPHCYQSMFSGCYKLTKAPQLPATQLVDSCYKQMFKGCSSLSYIEAHFTEWLEGATTDWLKNTYSNKYKFCIISKKLPIIIGDSNIGENWNIQFIQSRPLTFTAQEENSSVNIRLFNGTIFYRINNTKQWLHYKPGTTIQINKIGDSVQFLNIEENVDIRDCDLTGKIAASGDIQSLLNYSQSCPNSCYYQMFQGCTSLTKAPELTATTLAPYCYCQMFVNCTSLTEAPELPATTLAQGCYYQMFQGCTSLIKAPSQLPATTLAQACYRGMFSECYSLTEAPQLPATQLAWECYNSMFSSCTSLTTAPQLPATKLTDYCYRGMFSDCTSLTTAPQLLATQLAYQCYRYMFMGCTSLTKAPQLPATKLAPYCYQGMFSWCNIEEGVILPATTLVQGCYKNMFRCCYPLSYIEVHFTQWLNGATDGWLEHTYNYNEKCSILCLKSLSNIKGPNNIPDGWIRSIIGQTPLTFTAEQQNSSISFTDNLYFFDNPGVNFFYKKKENKKWIKVNYKTTIQLPNVGDTVQWLGNSETIKIVDLGTRKAHISFSMTGKIAASGNVQSLMNYAQSCTPYCYYKLFANCTSLTTAPTLSATTLANGCCSNMFYGCTSLTKAPQLPATELANSCYASMLVDCTSLTEAPQLPATQLADGCYQYMFAGCTSLTTAPQLPATDLKRYCYTYMLSFCESLQTPPVLPATRLAWGCYFGMFAYSTALKTAPQLPSLLISPQCYQNMFHNCTSLTEAPQLPATDLYPDCYNSMFFGCTSLIKAPTVLPATELNKRCYACMFYNCTSLLESPYIRVTEPSEITARNYSSCDHMFCNCSSLNYIKTDFTQWNSTQGTTDNWVQGVSKTGIFEKCKSLPFIHSSSHIPYGWMPQIIGQSPLTFTAVQASSIVLNVVVATTSVGGVTEAVTTPPTTDGLYYKSSTVGQWQPYIVGTTIQLPNAGDTVQFFNSKEELSLSSISHVQFSMTGKIEASGDIQSLLNYSQSCTKSCYYKLFANCTSLTTAPKLSATTLVRSCYSNMFRGCTSLTTAPELPATQLDYSCYYKMFTGCTSLTVAPQLPATELADSCYQSMFENCTSLTTAPQLIAMQLTESCYSGMFSGCTSLTEAPQLPANALVTQCYNNMFNGCSALKYIKVHFIEWLEGATTDWVNGVSSTGTFLGGKKLPIITGINNIPEGWTIQNFIIKYPLTFTAVQPKSVLYLYSVYYIDSLQYRLSTTQEWQPYTLGTPIVLYNIGDIVQFQNTKQQFPGNRYGNTYFSMTGKIAAYGNIQSLMNYSQSCTPYCYHTLFAECTSLTEAPQLSATTLAQGCYGSMFRGCTSLTTAPYQLPATTLADYCYQYMFQGCTSLTTAPSQLPATTLANYCYNGMFSDCRTLQTPPELVATVLKQSCYRGMFRGCTSLTEAPQLSATTLSYYCCYQMFKGCTSLKEAPQLPATTLAYWCYQNMFSGCTSLTKAPQLPATTLAPDCYQGMFSGCTSLTEAPQLPATKLTGGCYENMFHSCTSLTKAPQLSTTTLAQACYRGMFSRCTSLTEAPELPAVELTYSCYQGMFSGCTSLTTAPQLIATQLIEQCYKSMFQGCSSLNSIQVRFRGWKEKTTDNWLSGVATTGVFFKSYNLPEVYGQSNIPQGWNINQLQFLTDSLTFTASLSNSTIKLDAVEMMQSGRLSLDGILYKRGTSTQWSTYTCGTLIQLQKIGDSVQFKNTNEKFSLSTQNYFQFSMTGEIAASGNIQSLMNYSQSCTPYCYTYLFKDCRSLVKAPQLPATTLAEGCYYGMFEKCSSLIEVYELPAIKLADLCYHNMFYDCTSLKIAPKLCATELANSCYIGMFGGCTSLRKAPQLPATTLAYDCYDSMFGGCTSLTEAPQLPATTLTDYCYYSMFGGCTSLTKAPQLPATTLAYNCYQFMFSGCTSLNYIKVCFTEWLEGATIEWLSGVSSEGSFIKPVVLQTITGQSYIPTQWVVNEPLTFISTQAYSSVTLNAIGSPTVDGLQYRTGTSGQWLPFTCGTTISLANIGDTVQFQNTKEQLSTNSSNFVQFSMTGQIKARGNIQSMLNYSSSCTPYCYSDMFRGCTSLTTTPTLSATTLAAGCYSDMFSGCTSLTKAPELTATTLASYCYDNMFFGCTSLTEAPQLPATQLAYNCYQYMFYACTSLTEAPELPATQLANNCYSDMFSRCTSLTEAPELPATILTNQCYANMFYGCTSLTKAPQLPATTLAYNCYQSMFRGCTSLITAPELPATQLTHNCYISMFFNCPSLKYIKVHFIEWLEGATTNWVSYVASTGTFQKPAQLPITTGVSNIPEGWTIQIPPLTFKATRASSSVTLNAERSPVVDGLQYRTGTSGQWLPYTCGTTISLANIGDTVQFQNTKEQLSTSSPPSVNPQMQYLGGDYVQFSMTGKIAASGNIQSLLNYSQSCTKSCYYKLFAGCISLTTAPALSATTLAYGCYSNMFRGCTSLTTAPQLPATTLAQDCYGSMFYDCTSLTTAPQLPVTTLANWCYHYMFYGCTSLTEAPQLPATTLTNQCYANMFEGCSSLTEAPQLPATKLTQSCYRNMFSDCISLTTAPQLLATQLAYQCYHGMFYDCTSLTGAPGLPATTLAERCYQGMFCGCTSLRGATNLPATVLAPYCYSSMFGACTYLTEAPQLPATTLAQGCYKNMFSYCIYLKEAPQLPATKLAPYCYQSMFSYCYSIIAPQLPATTLAQGCYKQMFKSNPAAYAHTVGENFKLPATTLAPYCYQSMFQGGGLHEFPQLPATTLVQGCYKNMFKNCSGSLIYSESLQYVLPAVTLAKDCYYGMFFGCSLPLSAVVIQAIKLVQNSCSKMFQDCSMLSRIQVHFTQWLEGATSDWVLNVRQTGVFIKYSSLDDLIGSNNIPINWQILKLGQENLKFTALQPSSVTLNRIRNGIIDNIPSRQYTYTYTYRTSQNYKEGWKQYKLGDTIKLNKTGDTVEFKGTANYNRNTYSYPKFSMTGKISATGNMRSLSNFSTKCSEYCFYKLFEDCTSLVTAPQLSFELNKHCYDSMFAGCTNLVAAPQLPATTLAQGCYKNMFHSCSSLAIAPDLPATRLSSYCYQGMFTNCTSLTSAPQFLPTRTGLLRSSYSGMFIGCSSLSYIKVHLTAWDYRNNNWLFGVNSTGTFVKPYQLSELYGPDYIPEGWTIQNF